MRAPINPPRRPVRGDEIKKGSGLNNIKKRAIEGSMNNSNIATKKGVVKILIDSIFVCFLLIMNFTLNFVIFVNILYVIIQRIIAMNVFTKPSTAFLKMMFWIMSKFVNLNERNKKMRNMAIPNEGSNKSNFSKIFFFLSSQNVTLNFFRELNNRIASIAPTKPSINPTNIKLKLR